MIDPLVPSFVLFTAALVHTLVVNAWRDRLKKAIEGSTALNDVADRAPHITVIVPARNAADTLVPLLQDLNAQDLPKENFAVILVDDHSDDSTSTIAQGMVRMWSGLKVLMNEGTGKKAAITTGVCSAEDGIILLTDADARCGRSRLRNILHTMEGDGLDLLLLPVHTESAGGFIGRLQEEEQAGLLGMAASEALLGRPSLAYGANMAFTRKAFEEVGGYRGDRFASGDDVFLLQRMKQANMRIGFLYDQRVLVTVKAETTWGAFLQQRLRWAGKMRGLRGAFPWIGSLALLLPWLLVAVTVRFKIEAIMEGHGFEALLFLVLAWLLWIIPPVALVGDVRRYLGQRRSPLITTVCYVVFTVYAPLIAITSIFIRPRWKGRKT